MVQTATQESAGRPRALLVRVAADVLRAFYLRLDLCVSLLLALMVVIEFLRFPMPANIYLVSGDGSWQFDMLAKAQQHVWLGKDVVFTYGPLLQLLFRFLAWTADISLGDTHRVWLHVPALLTIALVYLTARLLLCKVEPWKRALYVLIMVVFWSTFEIKLSIPLCLAAVFIRIYESRPGNRLLLVGKACGAALLITCAFLSAVDAGFYTLAFFVLAAIAFSMSRFLDRGDWSPPLVLAGLGLGFFFLLAIAVNTLFGSPTDFRYWIAVYELVSSYRWCMPFAMDHHTTVVFCSIVVACFSVILWAWLISRSGSPDANVRARILAIAAMSVSILQSALIRSELWHVTSSLFVLLGFAYALLLDPLSVHYRGWKGQIPILIALVLAAAFTGPVRGFTPSNLLESLKTPATAECPAEELVLDQACLSQDAFLQIHSASSFLQTRTKPTETVMVFPFENVYGDVARRRVAGGVLQNYIAGGSFLTRQHLTGLERDRPAWAVYSADGLASLPVDGVPDFTRTPEIWFYLDQHFHRVANLELGIVGLQRDEHRAERWTISTINLPIAPALLPIKEGQSVELADLSSMVSPDVDFLKLRIHVHYPVFWRGLKPASMMVFLQRADGTRKAIRAIAQPNHSYAIWIYPWEEYELMNYFLDSPADWRKSGARPAVTRLSVEFKRLDWISVMPSKITLDGVDGVTVSLK